jgi:hypothetical protein
VGEKTYGKLAYRGIIYAYQLVSPLPLCSVDPIPEFRFCPSGP